MKNPAAGEGSGRRVWRQVDRTKAGSCPARSRRQRRKRHRRWKRSICWRVSCERLPV